MPVTEQLMGWGSWSIRLKGFPDDTTPGDIWSAFNPEISAFGHILITPTHVDPGAVGDAGMLTMSKYTGLYRGKPSRNEIRGVGLGAWLGDEDGKGDIAETPVTGTGGGGFDDWINDLLPASLTAGTITVIAGTLTESMLYMSPRAMLARVMDYFGGVYRINPDGTLDAGVEADLFATTPEVVLIWQGSGPDLNLTGLHASQIDISADLEDYTTRAVLLAEGQGSTVQVGSANISPATPYKDLHGNAVVLKRLISAPDVSGANANTIAAAQLGRFNGVRTAYRLSTDEWGVATLKRSTKRLEPGDSIWVYDPRPDAKLVDPANQIMYKGQVLMPAKMRLEAITWPIQEGHGIYFRYWSGSAFTIIDLSHHVEWETGDTTLDVGAAARRLTSDPTPAQIQGRIQDTTVGVVSYETGGGQAITDSTNTNVDFDTDEYDPYGFHNTSSNTDDFTVPAGLGGLYHMAAQVEWDSDIADTERTDLFISVNGSGVGRSNTESLGARRQQADAYKVLADGDVVNVSVFHIGGASVSLNGGRGATWFAMARHS